MANGIGSISHAMDGMDSDGDSGRLCGRGQRSAHMHGVWRAIAGLAGAQRRGLLLAAGIGVERLARPQLLLHESTPLLR